MKLRKILLGGMITAALGIGCEDKRIVEYRQNPNYVSGKVFGESSARIPQGGSTRSEYCLIVENGEDKLKYFKVQGYEALKLDALIDEDDIVTIILGHGANPMEKDFIISYIGHNNKIGWACALTKIEKNDGSRTINIDPNKGP